VGRTVSDDSDIFLFGGRCVFRHAFSKRHNLELFDAQDVANELEISREDLINLALLLGSDYTDGSFKKKMHFRSSLS
jgi:DNA excision repair protein ERCC-5